MVKCLPTMWESAPVAAAACAYCTGHGSPPLRSGVAARRSHPATEPRGGGREEQSNVQGTVAERAEEGLEELSHFEGQDGRWCGDTPHPR